MKPSEKVRALIAVALDGNARVISTDSPILAWDVEQISADTEDLDMGTGRGYAPGLYFWEGVAKEVSVGEDHHTEREYVGKFRLVTPGCAYTNALLDMTPPENASEDKP